MNEANKPRIVLADDKMSEETSQPAEQSAAGQTLPDSPQGAVRSVETINKDLKSYPHADAHWWSYNPTHRSFELVVGAPTGSGKIVLCLAGCDHITGPVRWKNQKLEAKSIRDAKGQLHFTIVDEAAGFRAVGDELRSFLLITTQTQDFP